MSVFRLSPLSHRTLGRGVGRCSACGKSVSGEDTAVRIYGEIFHHACAYYRPRGTGRGRERQPVG